MIPDRLTQKKPKPSSQKQTQQQVETKKPPLSGKPRSVVTPGAKNISKTTVEGSTAKQPPKDNSVADNQKKAKAIKKIQ